MAESLLVPLRRWVLVALVSAGLALAAGLTAPARGEDTIPVLSPPLQAEAADTEAVDLRRWMFLGHLTTSRGDGVPGDVDGVIHLDGTSQPEPNRLALRAFVSDKESTDLRTVIGSGEHWHLMRFEGSTTSAPVTSKLSASGQLPYRPIEPGDPAGPFEESQGPTALTLKGETDEVEIGLEYRSLGKRLERVVAPSSAKKDQEGHELWLARQLGLLRLRLGYSELTDNVDRNPALPRTTKAQTAVTTELMVPAWPVLGLTFAAGDAERVALTADEHLRSPDRQAFDSVTGSTRYAGDRWDVTASSTYSRSRDALGLDDGSTALRHELSLSLRPADVLTLVPTVAAGRERNGPSEDPLNSGSASLTLTYDPTASRWQAWTLMSLTVARSTEGTVDNRGLGLSGGLTRDLGKFLLGRSSLSFEAGYDQYRDGVSPAGSFGSVHGFLLFKLAGF